MFTGLIEEIGVITGVRGSGEGFELAVRAGQVLGDLKTGDSIAVSGPCLTVTAVARDSFRAFVMPETMKKSTLGSARSGRPVNLERALTPGGRLGGHLVSGHIDDVVGIEGVRSEGGVTLLFFRAPGHLLRYIVPKGSVALDGVSLTVIDAGESGFSVGLIPHTAHQTTLGRARPGDRVNIEVDLIGKYVEKMVGPYRAEDRNGKETVNMNYLQEKGYL